MTSEKTALQILEEELRYALPTKKILYNATALAVKVGEEYVILKNSSESEFNPSKAVLFNKNMGWEYNYEELTRQSVILGNDMINSRGHEAIQEYLKAKELAEAEIEPEPTGEILFVGIVKVIDTRALGQWSSGNSSRTYAKSGFKTRKEARGFIVETTEYYKEENKNRNFGEKFSISQCIVSYDTSDSESVEKFFKYMS